MTKDEMVQRLYIQFMGDGGEHHQTCLALAQNHANKFFESHNSEANIETYFVDMATVDAIRNTSVGVSANLFVAIARMQDALRSGKSVRVK